MANCIFVSNDDLERYSKELGISKLAVHATIMAMTEGKEVDSIPSPQEVKEYRQRNNIVAKVTDNSLSEMASIKQQAIANGTFMKAPNGKPTNLTESQWLQVRTKAFKDWFGDWERVARSSKYRRSQDTPNSITSATYQGVTVSDVKFDPDMAPDGGTRIIFLGNEYIGEIPVFEDDNSIHMGGTIGAATEIEEAYRGKGYGKKAHIALANIAKSEGKVLYSDSSNSDVEDALWKSLVEKGIAEVVSEKPKIGYWNHTTYRIINDALPQADDVNPGDRGVSKVVDENGEPLVTYHTSPHSEFSSFDTHDRRIEINPDGSYDRSMMAFVYDMSDEEIDEAIRDYENNDGTSVYTAKSKGVSSSYAKTESQMFDIREREIIDNADSWIEQDDLAKEGLYDETFAFARVRDQWTGEVDKSREEVLRGRFGLSKEEFDEKLKEIDAYLESKTEKFTESNKFELFEDYVNKKMKSLRHNYSNDYNSSSDEIIGSQYALFVKMKNPLIVDAKGNNWNEIQYKGKIESTRTLEKIAKDNGYDGVIVKNVYDIGGEMSFPEATDVFSVRDANSVKSATDNNGEFSRKNNDIYQEGEVIDPTAKRDTRLDSLFKKQRVNGKVTVTDLISLIDSNSEFSSVIELLKTKKDGRKPLLLSGVKVVLSEGDMHDVFKGRRAFYDSSTKTIHINTLSLFNNGNADSVILHEILHSITVNRILGNQNLRRKFDAIITEYKKHFYTSRYSKNSLNNEYSSHYMEEFIADIWSNRRLIEQLKSIKSTSKLTLWDKIKRFFTKIFAGSDGTLMADASDALYRLLDSPEAVRSGDMYYEGEQAQQQSSEDSISTNNNAASKQHSFRFADGTVVSTPFIPNAQQEDALNQIDEFIKSDETIMTLSGYAGTGKTSLMEMIAAKYRSSFKQIVFTATTNKAASVLKERVKKLGYEATTLHKAFGITAAVDEKQKEYDAKNKTSKQTGEPKVPYYGIVVVDEASMLDEKNYQIIKKVAEGYNLKVIFLGDEAQLAPVKEDKESIVFRNPEGRIVRLTKVERTGDNAILKEATALRNGKSLSGESSFNDKGQGVAFMSPNDWKKIEPIIKQFAPRLVTDPNYFRVLAYTNNTVAKYNEAIRRALGRTSAIPSVGEPIIGYNNWGYLSGAGATATYRFMNSESYVVKSVGSPTTVTHTMLDGRTVSLEAIPITIEDPMGNTDTIDFIDIKNNQQNKKNAEILAQENRRLWTLRGTPQWTKARKEKQEIEQLLFVNDVIYNEDVTTEDGGHPVLQEKLWDFGYAMTIHKSQGSTFTHVIIDDADITKGTQQDGQANKKQQLEYVGVSRATDTVTVLSHNVKTEDTPLAHVQEPAEDQTQQPEKETQARREISIQEQFFNNEFGGNFEGGGSFFDEYNQLSGSDLNEEEQKKLQDAVNRVEEIYMGGVDIPMSIDDLNIIFNYMKRVNPEAYKLAREDFKKRHPDLWNPVGTSQAVQQQSQQAQQTQHAQYQSVKITESTGGYAQRTKENADWSDVTLALAVDFNTAGERLTKKVAGNKYVGEKIVLTTESGTNLDYPVNYFPETARRLLTQIEKQGLPKNNVKLNIAGNGIYTFSNFGLTQEKLNDWVTAVIGELQNLGVTISEIRSGGQTGVDEAGIIAAQRLGIPSSVHAPKGFVFRTADKKDIADRASFERRFNQTQQQNGIPASYEGKITPDANTVFVFGSNPEGRHGAGAAKVAREQFGAIYGQGEGLQGNAYALPTKDLRVKENNGLRSISPKQIIEGIKKMYEVARQNPDKQFKVAYTNGLNETTLNGYTGREMIQMFKDAGPIPSNVMFSKNWTDHWNEVASRQPRQQAPSQQLIEEEATEKQEAPIISSEELISERPVLNAIYPTLTIKRDRTNAIARRFSKLLDKKLDERKKELQEQLSQAEAANNDDLATSLYIKLSTLTRQSFLKDYGLKKMFEEVRDSFNPDNVTREDEEKFFEDNYDRGDGWTDEEYNAWLDERVDHKKNEYRKIQENFWPLAEESTLAIKKLEHIIIDISKSATSTDTNTSSELNEDNSNSENETNNVMDKEEKTPESWMNNFRSISGMDSLSQKTRAALNNLLQLDMEGYETFDDIGENRYMDPEYAHAILLYGLGNMTKSDDFESALLKLGNKYSFVRLLYSLDEDGKPQGILEDDHQLKAAFYQDFRKDLTSYWASRGKRNPDGSFNKDATFPLNSKENTKWLLDSWKYNTEGGIQIGGQESAFNPDSTINADAVKRIIEKLTPIYNDLKSISGTSKERNAKIEQYLTKDKDKNWHTFVDILRSIGIDQEEGELRWALVDSKIANDSPIAVFDVLEKANSILSNLQSAKYQKVDKDGNKVPVDILKEFTGYYTDIANLIGFIGENSTESSFHHLDKTRYSYTVPNYLGKVLKELKNVNSDEKRFKAYIEDNFGRYQWFRDKEHDVWFNSWIEDLVEHPELRKVLDHKVVLDFNKKGFFEAGSLEYSLGLLREFNAPKDANQAWYYVPMLSDTDSSEFIKFTKDVDNGYQQRLIDKMTLTVLQEYNRIKLVRERKVGVENGTVDPIANFDEVKGKGGRGLKFCFFPDLNSWKDENGDSFLDLMDSLSDQKREASGNAVKVANINTQVRALIATALNDIIERDVDDNFKKFSELGVFDMENGKYKYMKGSDEGDAGNREIVSKYVYNSRFATSQIIQIFATDLAYYSNATDFQKRFKEIHAPALRLYTKAEYNGKRVGKDIERSIYLADEKILSNTYEQLKQALDERVEAKILSPASRDYILKQYQNINSSDAQAYRTLDSYRAILVMSGQWNDALEQAYNNFQSGNWTIEDFSQIFQTKKPYLYTQVSVGSQVSGYGDMKVGMQHKNSEFLLLAMLPKLVKGTSMQDAFKLRAIDQFMHNPKGVANPDPNDVIDVVNFTSAVKVGNQGVIDLNYKTLHQGITYKGKNYKTNEDAYKLKKELDSDLNAKKITRKEYDDILGTFKFKDEDEVTKHLNKVTKNGTSPITIHSASYEDYGIQTQTPEHIIDHEQLLGTQIRKLIGADITPGTMLSVGDVNMTAEEWWKVYNGILVDNIAQSYEDVYERFATPEALEQLLVETIKGNDRYPNDLLNAVRLVDELDASGRPTGNKRFNIPLFDLGTAELVESLVNSIIKDNVTKQKIRGGSCIQVSSFGLSDKLKVKYNTDENGKTHVEYMECYMPAYAKEFYQAFMKKTDDGNYILDMKDFPEELRYAIGYRVPTEDKYSMAPLKIVGFLPQQNGSAIMLPAEITTLSGSDFDVDKMYIMLPEFDVIRYDKSKAIQDFKKFNQKYAQAQSWIDSIFDIIVNESDKDIEDEEGNEITEAHADFKTWWKENKENYKLDRPKFRKIKGTFKSDANGKNVSFDDGLSNKENPSRADKERARKKRNNAIIDMMFSVLTNPDTLPRFVKPGGFEEVERQAFIQRILENIRYSELEKLLKEDSEITFTTNVSETLNSIKTDKLSDLASKYGKVLDPLSPLTQIHFHKQNSAGSKAIGIYAVNNAGQALLQHTNLSLSSIQKGTGKDGVGKINILGKDGDSLHDIRNSDGEYITNNEAQYLAASVDNGKKPTLEDNGQNDFTFNMSNALARLGFRHREIAAIMNQPIIKELAEAVTKGVADGKIKDAIINEVLGKYAAKAGVSKAAINNKVDVSKATLEDFYKDRCLKTDSDMDAEYYRRQLNIGIWFKNNDVNAVAVNTVTQNLRADAQNAAAGPAVVDTVLRELKIESHINSDMGLYDPGEDYTKEEMKEHPLGFMMAFQQYGIKKTSDLLSKYFPQYSESFIDLLDDFMRRTKHNSISVETAQRLFDATILYQLNHIPNLNNLKGKVSTPEDVARYLINEFPNEFSKIKKSEKFADNPFIKSLKVVSKSNNVVVPTIMIDTTGRLTKEGKHRITQGWESLMYSGDPEAIDLATTLFTYSLVRYAGKYSPAGGFAHLVPVAVREGTKGYIDALENLRKRGTVTHAAKDFRVMFMRNNTFDSTLFPRVSDTEAEAINNLISKSQKIDGRDKAYDIKVDSESMADDLPTLISSVKIDKSGNIHAIFRNGFSMDSTDDDGKKTRKYFVLVTVDDSHAELTEVEPLGVKGAIQEYFLNDPYGESVIPKNEQYNKENPTEYTPEDYDGSGYDVSSSESGFEITEKKDAEGQEICE